MNIGIIVLLIIFATNLTFQCLIKKNIINPSKVSRIFYQDDEGFVNSWKKTQEKGILKYIIKNTITMTIMMGIVGVITILYKPQSLTLFEYLSMGVILGLANSIFWRENQNRYNQLKEKKKK